MRRRSQVAQSLRGTPSGRPGRRPRPGTPRTITDDDVEPSSCPRWRTPRRRHALVDADLAKRVGMSPHRWDGSGRRSGSSRGRPTPSKLSEDPLFIDKVRDVVGLPGSAGQGRRAVRRREDRYPSPRSHPTDPADAPRPGRAPHPRLHPSRGHRPVRRVEPGHRRSDRTTTAAQHRAVEFKNLLLPSTPVPADLDVHLVLDNPPPTRRRPSTPGCFVTPASTFIHPDQLSWLNLVERWFAEPTRRLHRSAHRPQSAHRRPQQLDRHLERQPPPFVWHKTADQILDNLKQYLTNLDAGH